MKTLKQLFSDFKDYIHPPQIDKVQIYWERGRTVRPFDWYRVHAIATLSNGKVLREEEVLQCFLSDIPLSHKLRDKCIANKARNAAILNSPMELKIAAQTIHYQPNLHIYYINKKEHHNER